MNSVYEFGIYLTHFCNVDLFRQGLYFFRIGLYKKEIDQNSESADGEIKHYALPYRTMLGKQHERDFLIRSSDRQQSLGHIDDVTSSYFSSVFRVQYQEQKVRLNEGCLFRLDLPYEPKQSVFIDIELVFCELHASDYKSKGFPTFDMFTIVDKTTLCMEDCYRGIHSIYPVSFSTSHFCLLNCMVHGELINFKFIPPPPQHKLIAKYVRLKQMNGKNIADMNHQKNNQHAILAQQHENDLKQLENRNHDKEHKQPQHEHHKNNVKIQHKAPSSSSSSSSSSPSTKKQSPSKQSHHNNPKIDMGGKNEEEVFDPIPGKSSFAECLFYDRVDCILTEQDWNSVSEHHLFYMACLLHTYEKLQKIVHQYVDVYLDDANIPNLQSEFEQLYPVPNIELDEHFSTRFPLQSNAGDNDDTKDKDKKLSASHSNASSSSSAASQSVVVANKQQQQPFANGLANLDVSSSPRSSAWKYTQKMVAIKDRFSAAEKREMTGRQICHIVGEDVHKIAGQVFRVWHFFLSLIPFCKRLLTRKLLYEWENSFVERWGACIFRETLTVRARLRVVSTSLSEHEMISRKVRSQSTLNQLEPPPLQDIVYMIDPKQQAVIFEQTYNLPDNRSSESVRLLDQIGANSTNNNNDSPPQTASNLVSTTISSKKKLKDKLQRRSKDKDNQSKSSFIIIAHKKDSKQKLDGQSPDHEKQSPIKSKSVDESANEVPVPVLPPMADSLHINKDDDIYQSNLAKNVDAAASLSSLSSTPVVLNDDQQPRKPPLIVRSPALSENNGSDQKQNDDDNEHPAANQEEEKKLDDDDLANLSHELGLQIELDSALKELDDDDSNHNSHGSRNRDKKRKKLRNGSVKNKKKRRKHKDDCSEDMHLETDHECIGKHLFVLVHGYQGNSWDMRMFRNHLLVKCPNDLFLMSEANEQEGQTEGDITEMGQRLANEIVEFIEVNISSQHHKLCRLSFITHSLGGIIAREALSNKALQPFVSQCYTFISLAVCHCGYLFGRSKALQAGFWVMRSWKKSLCLSQLSLTDDENPRKTYMYKLSQKPSLSYFQNVLLVSSPEDRYTPYHSTRIEMHRKTVQDTKWGRIYNEMVRNLLRPLDNVNLTRFDVSFVNRKINLDSMIGRSAHICFLEQPLYIDMLIHVYKKYFVST